MKGKKYWEFKALSQNEAELYMYVEIASWGGGYYAHSAQSFKEELDGLGEIDVLNVYVNSPGGDVFEGFAIANMLKNHKAKVNIYVDGLAASISAYLLTAGDTVTIRNGGMVMVHNSWSNVSGDANYLRDMAGRLDKIDQSMRNAFVEKSNGKATEEQIKQLMDEESWLSANDCLNYGLCDYIEEKEIIAAKFDGTILNQYKNTPKELINTDNKLVSEPQALEKDKSIEIMMERVNNKLKYN